MSRFSDLLADFQAERRFLVVVEPYYAFGSTTLPYYFSSHGFNSEPGDTPANTHYAPRLRGAYTFTRAMFSGGKLSGRSVPGFGSITLANADGGLDALANLAWGGRRVRVWLGGKGFALAEFGLIFDGTAQGLSYGDKEIVINLRDLAYVMDGEVQAAKFAGTGGAEGAADLKDKRKPDAWGINRNVPPVLLGNVGGKWAFSVASGPIVGVLGVFDKGAPLAYAANPGPGQYGVDLAAGTITLGGSYVGPVTAHVIGRRYLVVASTTSVAVGTGAKTFTVPAGQRLAVGMRVRAARSADLAGTWMDGVVTAYAGTALTVAVDASQGSGSAADWTISPWGTPTGILCAIATQMGVTTFNDAQNAVIEGFNPRTAGYWIPEGGNAGQILDAIAAGSGSNWGFDRAGLFEVSRLDLPPIPVAFYDSTQVLSVERVATEEPSAEITVRYARNWQVLSGDQLAGIASPTAFSEEWRQSNAVNPFTKAAYPLGAPIVLDSVYDEQAAAEWELSRQINLFGNPKGYFKVRLKMQPLLRDVGDYVSVAHPRYGMDGGRTLTIVEIDEDMDDFTVTLGLWGG